VLQAMFRKNRDMRSVVVQGGGKALGLISRVRFNNLVYKRLGGRDWEEVAARELMQTSPLRVEHDAPIEVVNRRAMARPVHQVYDDIIVEASGSAVGVVTQSMPRFW